MEKSVTAIVLADRRPAHDVAIGVNEIPGARAPGNHPEVPHAACGIPNEGMEITRKTAVRYRLGQLPGSNH